LDARDTVSHRIRDGEMKKVPYIGVVGEREAEAGTVAVRKRGAEQKQVVVERGRFVGQIVEEIETRARD
jgi:threonyl-tRNA synthetase